MTQFRILNSHPRGDTIDAGTVFPDRNSELRIEHWFNPRPDFHPTVRTEAAPRLRASGSDGGRSYTAEFRVFRENGDKSMRRDQRTLGHDLNPGCSFIEFFLHNPHLVNEIGSTFRSTRLRVIWSGRGATPQDLGRNMSALKVLRCAARQSNNPCREFMSRSSNWSDSAILSFIA